MNREEHDRHEHREIDHKNFSRFSRLSRLVLLRTLRFRILNRERRERGPLLSSRLSVPTLEGRGNLLLGLFLEPLRGCRGHSLFCSRFSRVSRLESLWTLRFRNLNRERHEQGETGHKNFRGFTHLAGRIIANTPVRNINREQRERRERYEQREINHKIIFAVRMTADTLSIS